MKNYAGVLAVFFVAGFIGYLSIENGRFEEYVTIVLAFILAKQYEYKA